MSRTLLVFSLLWALATAGCSHKKEPVLDQATVVARHAVRGRRWKRVVVIVVILIFLAIDAYGLCNTYGAITIA